MASKNEANVKLNADATGVVKGVAVAQGALGKLEKQLGSLESLSAKGLSLSGLAGIGLSATAAAAALMTVVRSAADYGDQLDNMSQRTGIAVEDLSKLQYAAKMSDTSNEALAKGLQSLAGLMVAAAGGAEESSKLFEKYGISVRNADGSTRSSLDVLGDIADVFAAMPDGVEKSALAMEFFGKKLGPELIPLLNQGKEGLKALGDEAERLGLVMSADQAKAAAEFNDNLDKLTTLAGSAGRALGNAVIPHINTLLQKLMLARDNKLSFGQVIFDVLPDQLSIGEKIAKATREVEEMQKRLKKAQSSGDTGAAASIKEEIAQQERLLAYLNAQRKKGVLDEEAVNDKRLKMSATLAGKQQELERLRAVAAGKASEDILKSDKQLLDARLKDAERLRDALRSAYDQSVAEAKSAAQEAIALLDKARAKRASTADKVFEASSKGMTEEERAAAAKQQAEDLAGQGRYAAAAAAAAKLDGRLKEFEAYKKQAEELLDRASGYADKSGNVELIQQIGEAQAKLLEQQAAAKQAEAKAAEDRAAAQMRTLNELEAKIKSMQQQAMAIEIKADISQLEGEIAKIKAEIAKGAVMPVTVQQVAAGQPAQTPPPGSFAGGGWTGWGGKYDPAGIVHRREYVTPMEVTAQPGVLPFLEALRKYGNKVLPGYAGGGLVGALALPTARMPAPAANHAGAPVNLVLDGRRYPMSASQDVAAALVDVVRREALRKGGRR